MICGSSYKNIGIESLLDAIVRYLPTPLQSAERHLSELSGSLLLARCFKIIHDKQRGAVALFRIYSGQLSKVSAPILKLNLSLVPFAILCSYKI